MHQQTTSLTQAPSWHPATLMVGPEQATHDAAYQHLVASFCAQGGCSDCTECQRIYKRHHQNICWISPEKSYTLEDLEPLFEKIAFALADNELFFFIIEKADFLSAQCANRLLKSIEEPPAGYRFLLLATRLETILPTIRSRCMILPVKGSPTAVPHQTLYSLFTSAAAPDLVAVWKAIEESKITENESVDVLEALISYWSHAFKNALLSDSEEYKKTCEVLEKIQKAALKPPMPGSSKLFWRNLALMLQE